MLLRHINISIFCLLFVGLVACKDAKRKNTETKSPELIEIEKIEKELKEKSNLEEALPIAKRLEKEFITYATKNKKDSLSPKFIYQAARLNEQYFEDYLQAFAHYNSVVVDFEETRYTPVSMFKRGLIMETYLKKSDKAIYYLDVFIKKYPEHKMKSMALQIITSSGVDANDLFERINTENTDSNTVN